MGNLNPQKNQRIQNKDPKIYPTEYRIRNVLRRNFQAKLQFHNGNANEFFNRPKWTDIFIQK
jgi:hypothetical protein